MTPYALTPLTTRPLHAGEELALAGLALHRDLEREPEGVVMLAGQKVLSSPLETATPLLAVPEGAIVRMRESRGNWIEVELGETRGWLPADALDPVY